MKKRKHYYRMFWKNIFSRNNGEPADRPVSGNHSLFPVMKTIVPGSGGIRWRKDIAYRMLQDR